MMDSYNSCPNEPLPSSALYAIHMDEAKRRSIPTKLKEYVQYCYGKGNNYYNHLRKSTTSLIMNETSAACQGIINVILN